MPDPLEKPLMFLFQASIKNDKPDIMSLDHAALSHMHIVPGLTTATTNQQQHKTVDITP
jgi:hypothetical protein